MIDSRFIRTFIWPALLSLLIVNSLPSVCASDVAGLWSSISKSKGGIGTQLDLGSDGSLTQILGAVVDFAYETHDGKITMTFDDGVSKKTTTTQTFQLRDNALILDSGKGSEQVMQRTTQSPRSSGLVGEWNYEHYSGGPALLRYSSQRIGQLVVPMGIIRGRYDLDGRRMKVKLDGQAAVHYDLHVNEDTLSLRDESGKETAFRRFRY